MAHSLNIQLDQVGKRFYQRWLFRELSHDFSASRHLALIGPNGSGKSTLMRLISGQMAPTEGKIRYHIDHQIIPTNEWYRYLSWSGPYISLYPVLTLREHLQLHFRFKPCLLESEAAIIKSLRLEAHADKALRVYSSGMLQRVKVGTALFTDAPALFLDEPTSNMDSQNAAYMLELIHTHLGDRLWVLASNLEREFDTFEARVHLGRD